ncbi:hypothetical protein CHS0354_041096 [Potamilus streckersoni]|uniref:BTB domain-containing protein n=1 Tax=Potamilus streckersoni TaxID=2493646 RepID=A0AAE0SDQ8_9BIVA|nr:hypothetical protein CHS0354_041096 [Potamilus streckersoni]
MAATTEKLNSSRDTNGDNDQFNDVVLVVEGKRISTTKSILAENSSVFAEMFKTHPQSGKVVEVDRAIIMKWGRFSPTFTSVSSRAVQTTLTAPPTEIVLHDKKYRDIKKFVTYMHPKNSSGKNLTGDLAWILIPLATEYKVPGLKRKCGQTLMRELQSRRKDNVPGTVPIKDSLRYLLAAETNRLDKLKTLCIDECSCNAEVTARKEIVHSDVSDKTKVTILDLMCDNMMKDMEKKLKELSDKWKRRSNDIEKKYKEYQNKVTDWHKDNQEKLSDIQKYVQKELQGIKKTLEDKTGTIKEDIMYDFEKAKEDINETLKSIDTQDKRDAINLRDIGANVTAILEEGLENFYTLFEKSMAENLVIKTDFGTFATKLHESISQKEAYTKLSAEMAIQSKTISEIEEQKALVEGERDMLKLKVFEYSRERKNLNTWLKWGKP